MLKQRRKQTEWIELHSAGAHTHGLQQARSFCRLGRQAVSRDLVVQAVGIRPPQRRRLFPHFLKATLTNSLSPCTSTTLQKARSPWRVKMNREYGRPKQLFMWMMSHDREASRTAQAVRLSSLRFSEESLLTGHCPFLVQPADLRPKVGFSIGVDHDVVSEVPKSLPEVGHACTGSRQARNTCIAGLAMRAGPSWKFPQKSLATNSVVASSLKLTAKFY